MLLRFLRNHVLANLLFVLVLVMGTVSYLLMPREQDPTINFNWIDITTVVPGASAADVERRVTDVLEEAVRKVRDIRFVSSNSRESVSNILVRFEDMDTATFDKRVSDLRRELQDKESELPEDAQDPVVMEITTDNALPVATVLVVGTADDENLRLQAEIARKDLERIEGVDRILDAGLREPELIVDFRPERLQSLGIAPTDLADTVRTHYRDLSAGSVKVNDDNWIVRFLGTNRDPAQLAKLPVLTAQGEVPLGSVAEVHRGREEPTMLVRYRGAPAIMLAVTKQAKANTIELVGRIGEYVAARNRVSAASGVNLVLADDQTETTRAAIRVMQTNAGLGLLLVLLVTWIFLGSRIALFTCIGIPFILAGTLWVLDSVDQTVNVAVLLGIVISLGMLVDDAVVVVEAIFYRVQRGMAATQATLEALQEVVSPVTTAVLTTMAAFLPLMLLPGIVGKFMFVIPFVVTVALAISLVEAFWMLPAHVMVAKVSFDRPSAVHRMRVRMLHWLRLRYTRALVRTMRYPTSTLTALILLFGLAAAATAAGMVKFDFFASDPIRLFYVNVRMPPGTPLHKTMDKALEVEKRVVRQLRPGEARSVVSYAGQMFTETAPFYGDTFGQVMISLGPRKNGGRSVDDVIDSMREDVMAMVGASRLSFQPLSGGPPVTSPISVKVRGDDPDEIRAAAEAVKDILRADSAVRDITDDAAPGPMELVLRTDADAARRAGVHPAIIARASRLFVDGEVVAEMQDRGEELEVRVRARPSPLSSIEALLAETLPSPEGHDIPLRTLLEHRTERGLANFRHYNFRRALTVEADIDKTQTDTVAANARIRDEWALIRHQFPNIDLDFTGELDDIQETIDAIPALFVFGVGLIYLILGTQFRSYFQPLMILTSVPMAFTGVVLGLLITRNPLSLFTLYGVVALAGIAVNSAIVLISAANARREAGMSVLHATVYAARRRVIPILITSLTTVAGLFSLATGLGGHSLLWGPVATAIVWGLVFSTTLTLFVIPLLYRLTMGRAHGEHKLHEQGL